MMVSLQECSNKKCKIYSEIKTHINAFNIGMWLRHGPSYATAKALNTTSISVEK